jgi:hypothetical protein
MMYSDHLSTKSHPSPEEYRENDVEKECHNKGDASDYECAMNKAIQAFAGDCVNDDIDDASDDCTKQTLPQRSDHITLIHSPLFLMLFPWGLLHTIKVFTSLTQNVHVNVETPRFLTSIVPSIGAGSRKSAIWGLGFYQLKQH